MNNSVRLLLSFLWVSLISACAVSPTNDPLKNTRHLVVEGHKSLYQNGAFQVPNTQLSLIPPGPSALEFAQELAGLKARQSFLTSIQNAKDSVQIISIGSQKTYQFSKDIFDGSNEFADKIREFSRPNSILLLNKSYPHAKYIIGASWQGAQSIAKNLAESGDELADSSLLAAGNIDRVGSQASRDLYLDALSAGAKLSSASIRHGGHLVRKAGKDFIQGYISLPKALTKRGQAMNPAKTWQEFRDDSSDIDQWRKQTSDEFKYYVTDTRSGYLENVGNSFAKSKEALGNTSETGSLALIKSLGWVLHGIFWEGSIKPAAKITAGSLGYVAVNTVVYPVFLAAQGSVALAEVAVRVTWNTAGAAYDIVAPTGKAALAGLLGTIEIAGGQLAGGAVIAGGTTLAAGEYVGTKAIAATVAAAGYTSGKAVKYIGVPLATSGVVIGGSAVGVTVGTTEAVVGTGLLAAGEVVSAGSQVVGGATSATTLAVGTTASTVAGLGMGVYELSKAVIVPTGYQLSSGVVLGYGSLSQLAAHSVLAVTDFSYMVLSLEGPNWVLYAVQGKLGEGDDLAPGTVLDLEQMQEQGETFKRLPISEQEMEGLIEHLPDDLEQSI